MKGERGGLKRVAAAAFTCLAVSLASAGSAGAAVLVSQIPNGSFSVPTVPSFVWPNNAARDTLAADDFTVPAGQVWTIQTVRGYGGTGLGPGGNDTASVAIYGGGTTPGAAIFNQSGIVLPTPCSTGGGQQCDIAANVTGAPGLQPGSYWVSLQTAVVEGEGYEWRWATYPPGESFGNRAVWQNPGDFYGTGCTSFAPLADCGLTASTDGADLMFRLDGEVIDSTFTLEGFESNGRRISMRATFRDPGKATVKGKKMKKASKQVDAGTAKLPIKLKRGAKRKLANGKRVKLKPSLTFEATGGVPFTEKATVNIVPVRAAAAGGVALRLVP